VLGEKKRGGGAKACKKKGLVVHGRGTSEKKNNLAKRSAATVTPAKREGTRRGKKKERSYALLREKKGESLHCR